MTPVFEISGTVIRGKNRGKALGFPTANTQIINNTPPGTYISQTFLKNKVYHSITFIGVVETFDENDFVAETYILDFDQDIYGEIIQVQILKKLRDNQKFETVEKLILQMKDDEQQARRYFEKQLVVSNQ